MSTVVVLDYGSGNVRSAVRALQRAGADVELTADPDAAVAADGLVVPGVGAFAACMAGLTAVSARQILDRRLAAGRPVLGICVGMQVLFSAGVEHGVQTEGLGLLAGRVEPLQAPVVPHMGWNTVTAPADSALFDGLHDARFYFVHSYAVHSVDGLADYLVTTTEHGESFVAAVESPLLSATQFHPEKSADAGARLLRNWLATL
ncbi:MAG: imidazole glycerol phosphate synthase subunit HisH [Actinomycetota bacterium]|nr:imidazole glycerol phosphate synthase subunit HisH [Actinomycetota bacterium]MDQ2955877.1 imidazole glycerol phosphate synthase subunit HisH [Actinomycetota bacterium]